MEASSRNGNSFQLSEKDKKFFKNFGFLTLHDVINESEILELEKVCDKFTQGKVSGMGRDLCDMSGTYDDEFKNFAMVNAMLPRSYLPEIQGNIYEKISQSIADQLLDKNSVLDYDQFIAKKPNHPRAEFAWHQDMGYWPMTKDTRTATFSLALTDSTEENGCLRLVPGSHKGKSLYPHQPLTQEFPNPDRENSHTLKLEIGNYSWIQQLPVKRGSIIIYDEWIVHGSSGNNSDQWRKTYIVAYRTKETVAQERSMGFTHSHNDKVNWKTTLELEDGSK